MRERPAAHQLVHQSDIPVDSQLFSMSQRVHDLRVLDGLLHMPEERAEARDDAGGTSASKALLSAGYGIGPTSSAVTGATSWKARNRFSPSSIGPAQQATIAICGTPWRASGMKGRGGAIWKAGNAPISSGACCVAELTRIEGDVRASVPIP